MANMLYRATKYTEDSMIARGGRLKKREKQDNLRPDRSREIYYSFDSR